MVVLDVRDPAGHTFRARHCEEKPLGSDTFSQLMPLGERRANLVDEVKSI